MTKEQKRLDMWVDTSLLITTLHSYTLNSSRHYHHMRPSVENSLLKGNERQCRDVGVVVQKYMSDNGKAFTSKEFQEHLSHYQQVSSLQE